MKFIIDKFSKRITIIFEKNIYTIMNWAEILLHKFDITNWNLSKIIISNRDKIFFANLWRTLFGKLNVKFFYFTVYHFQIDEQNERTNQILEIALRFFMITLNIFSKWSRLMKFIQRYINNFKNALLTKNSTK